MKRFRSHRTKTSQPEELSKSAASTPVSAKAGEDASPADKTPLDRIRELGGPDGLEPTRYGDWERKGICYDF